MRRLGCDRLVAGSLAVSASACGHLLVEQLSLEGEGSEAGVVATADAAADSTPDQADGTDASAQLDSMPDSAPLGDASGGGDGDGDGDVVSGACTPDCVNPNGTTQCVAGTCIPSCSGSFDDCDGMPHNGCETDVDTDPAHCSGCNMACPGTAGGVGVCNGGSCSVRCDMTGTWAAKLVTRLIWPATLEVALGSGDLALQFRVEAVQTGNTVALSLLPCGTTIPDFRSSPAGGNELYGLLPDDAVFDAVPPLLPETSTSVRLSALVPGAVLHLDRVAVQFGTDLADPLNSPWPIDPDNVPQVDADMDGNPGVTIYVKTGGSYEYIGLNPLRSSRADREYIAERTVFSADGALTSCSEIDTTASVSPFDLHILGCHEAGGSECSVLERDFLDSNRPTYTPSSSTFRMVKLDAGATCADVRATVP